jgi:glutamate N-acetyltransferase/amino-acid N-acetyltransferase
LSNYTIESMPNGLESVKGFYCGATHVGMRPDASSGDVAFIRSDFPCDVRARFTTNRFQAAPIVHYKRYPKGFQTNFLLINAKNANAMTGEKGVEDIESLFASLATKQDLLNPIISSTGVIGYRLPIEKITKGFDQLDFNAKDSHATASAIMTTDRFKKELAYRITLEDGSVFHIAGIAKGAGMINPTMATMLCFVTTDATIPAQDMEDLLSHATEESFNRISVDGDTSTNDTVMLLANSASNSYHKEAFATALNSMLFEFAMMILRDGEGSNKVVSFEVKGAKSTQEAQHASRALSNSLLVKTALFGEDPNWGRIASTIGASGVMCDEEKLEIHYDDLLIYSNSQRELDKAREERAYAIMKQPQFRVTCDLGVGDASYTSYGCDLSYEYVKINAEYRT